MDLPASNLDHHSGPYVAEGNSRQHNGHVINNYTAPQQQMRSYFDTLPQSEKDNLLLKAAEYGQLRRLELLLVAGANVDHGNPFQITALLMVALFDHIDCARMLLHFGADLHHKSEDGNTALCIAVKRNNIKMAKLLVDNGALHRTGDLAFQAAIIKDSYEMATLLLDSGFNIDTVGTGSRAPLMECVKIGSEKMLRLLCKRGASLNCADSDGCTALVTALLLDKEPFAVILIEAGADPDIPMPAMDLFLSPLYLAVVRGFFAAVKALVWAGADLETKNFGFPGKTVLMHACSSLSNPMESQRWPDDCLQLLLDRGADPNASDEVGETALFFAARAGDVHKIHALINAGANIDEKNYYGVTALMAATRYPEAMEVLLQRGACVNEVNLSWWTPLMVAVSKGCQPDALEVLFRYKADPRIFSDKGESLLDIATMYGVQESHPGLALLREYMNAYQSPSS